MQLPDGDQVAATNPLSRRSVLQLGVLTALATGEASGQAAGVGAQLQVSGSWDQSIDEALDPRAAIFEAPGVAVVFSDLLAVDEGTFYAFDVATGEPLWERPIVAPPAARYHDGTVYVQAESGLTALDPRTGAEQWTIEGAVGQSAAFAGDYAAFAGELAGATVVDLAAGEIAWTPEDRSMGEPLALADGQLVLRGQDALAAYDVATGDRLWTFPEFPAVAFETDISVRATWPFCFVTTLDPAATIAIDLAQGEELWRLPRATYPQSFPSGAGEGGVVLANDEGTLTRLGTATGEVRWERSLTEGNLFLYLVDGELAVPVADDHVWAVSTADGSVAWDQAVDTPFPAVYASNDAFTVAGTAIRTLDRTGNQLSMADLAGDEPLLPAVSDTHLIAPTDEGVRGVELEAAGATTTAPSDGSAPTTATATDPRGPTSTDRIDPDEGAPNTEATGDGFGVVSVILAGLVVLGEALRRTGDSGGD